METSACQLSTKDARGSLKEKKGRKAKKKAEPKESKRIEELILVMSSPIDLRERERMKENLIIQKARAFFSIYCL